MKIESDGAGLNQDIVDDLAAEDVVHNLNGQRLGRKGRETRERIISAADKLVRANHDLQISLSAVARESGMGLTSLYNYFGDLTELLLAVLERIMPEAEEAYLVQLQCRWNDDRLEEECRRFVDAFYGFWKKHTHILQVRNNVADQRDLRMIKHRMGIAKDIIGPIARQMDGDRPASASMSYSMASAIYMGLERAVSVLNNQDLPSYLPELIRPNVANILDAETRLLEFGIRDMRAQDT